MPEYYTGHTPGGVGPERPPLPPLPEGTPASGLESAAGSAPRTAPEGGRAGGGRRGSAGVKPPLPRGGAVPPPTAGSPRGGGAGRGRGAGRSRGSRAAEDGGGRLRGGLRAPGARGGVAGTPPHRQRRRHGRLGRDPPATAAGTGGGGVGAGRGRYRAEAGVGRYREGGGPVRGGLYRSGRIRGGAGSAAPVPGSSVRAASAPGGGGDAYPVPGVCRAGGVRGCQIWEGASDIRGPWQRKWNRSLGPLATGQGPGCPPPSKCCCGGWGSVRRDRGAPGGSGPPPTLCPVLQKDLPLPRKSSR